jgi:hypothetical protein
MPTKRPSLARAIAFMLLLWVIALDPTSVATAQQTPTPTPSRTPGPSPTPRTQALRKTVLANSVRGLGLNAPYDANLPPCQNADFGVGVWQDLQPVGSSAQVTALARQAGTMLRITDSFFPAICSTDPIGSASAVNLGTNETLPAVIWDYDPFLVQSGNFFYSGNPSRFYVAQLPIEAYVRPGNWLLRIDSPQTLEVAISIQVPAIPSGLLDTSGTYFVAGFQPGERVVALIFNDTSADGVNFVAEIKDDFEFIADSRGTGRYTSGTPYWNVTSSAITVGLMLLVGDQGSDLFYPLGEFGTSIFTTDGSPSPSDLNADGQITDQELIEYVRRSYWQASGSDGACPGSLPARLVTGQRARITPGNANNVRASATRDSERIGSLVAGAEFDVLSGPVCSGGYTWWQIQYGGLTGWTAESGDGNYWVEPVTGSPVIASPVPTGIPFTRNLFNTLPTITGEDVRMVQSRLTDLGYDPGPIDGIFGPRTDAAVRAYQRDNGLTIDGIVGPITWGSLFP